MTTSTAARDNPAETRAERDANGRFLSGNATSKRGGRPPGVDLRSVAEEQCREQGTTLGEALGKVVSAMLEKAQAGDTAAAKLLLDQFGVREEAALRLNQGAFVPEITVITGVPQSISDAAPQRLVVELADQGVDE